MRRSKIASILFLTAILLAGASSAYATMGDGDVTNRWGAGFVLGYALPMDDDADSSFYRGGVVTYGLSPNWVIQLDIGYASFSQEAHGIDYGDLQGVPVILSVQWRHPYSIGTSPAAWYVLGGIGAILWNLDSADEPILLGVEATASDAFAARIGGGYEVFFTDNIAVNIEGSYTFSSEDVKLIEPGTNESERQDSDFWLVGSGLRYYF